MANKYFSEATYRYNLLPIKLRLFIGMMIAAHTAATAVYLGVFYCGSEIDYIVALNLFLICRVVLFMANPNLPLTDSNVAIMSSERTLWNVMTLLIMWTSYFVIQLAQMMWTALKDLWLQP